TWCFPPCRCLSYQRATCPSLPLGTSRDVLLTCKAHAQSEAAPSTHHRESPKRARYEWRLSASAPGWGWARSCTPHIAQPCTAPWTPCQGHVQPQAVPCDFALVC